MAELNPPRESQNPSTGGNTLATGIPSVDLISMIISMLSGQMENIAPRPGKGESVYDSYYHRMRTQQQMTMILDQFSSNFLTQKMHAQASQMGGLADMLSGGMISRAMAPVLGGNPVQAAMSMFQRMTGMSTAFTGQMGPASTEQVLEAMKQFQFSGNFYRMGQGRPEGVDYSKTRGFEVQDLMSQYLRANELGLFNGRQFGMTGGFKQFTGAAGMGAMDAARSMGMSMDDLSSMFGKSGDLFSPDQAGKTEDLLRKVKAAAHVAGISMKAMKDIIMEGQNLMSMFPELSYVGGDAMMAMSTKAVGQARAIASTMSPLEFRRAGGHSGIIRSLQEGQAQSMAEPGSQQLMALYERVAGAGGDVSAIVNYMQNGDRTPAGQHRFLAGFAQSSGIGAGMTSIVTNTELARLGASRNPELAGAAGYGMQAERFDSWFSQAYRNLSAPQMEAQKQQMYKLWGANGGGLGGFAAATSSMGMDPFIQARMMDHLSYMGEGGMSYLRSRNDPTVAAAQQEQAAREAEYAARDKAYASRLGHLNAPPLHQALGALISGDWAEEGGLSKSLRDIYMSNGPSGETADEETARKLAGKVARGMEVGYGLLKGRESVNGITQMADAFTSINSLFGEDSAYTAKKMGGADWQSFLQGQITQVGGPAVLGMNGEELTAHIEGLRQAGNTTQAQSLEAWRNSAPATRARDIIGAISGGDASGYMRAMSGLGSNPVDYADAMRRVAAGGIGRNAMAAVTGQMQTNLNTTMNERVTKALATSDYGTALDEYKMDGKVSYAKISKDAATNAGAFGPNSKLSADAQKKLRETVSQNDAVYKQGQEEIDKVYGTASKAAGDATMTKDLADALKALKPMALGMEQLIKAITGVAQALGGATAGSTAPGGAT